MKAVLVAWLLALFSSAVMANPSNSTWQNSAKNEWSTKLAGHKLQVRVTRRGLIFSATITCPGGSPRKQAKFTWKVGDPVAFSQKSCQNSPGQIVVGSYMKPAFIEQLPPYPLIVYLFSMEGRRASLAKADGQS